MHDKYSELLSIKTSQGHWRKHFKTQDPQRLGVAGTSIGYLVHLPHPKTGSTPAKPFLTAVSPILLKHSNGNYSTLSPPVHSNAYQEHKKVFPSV